MQEEIFGIILTSKKRVVYFYIGANGHSRNEDCVHIDVEGQSMCDKKKKKFIQVKTPYIYIRQPISMNTASSQCCNASF